MLVLKRKRDERIMIGDDVELVVVNVQGDRVKLGFRAPQDVLIQREEVHERIREERDSVQENPVSARRRIPKAVA